MADAVRDDAATPAQAVGALPGWVAAAVTFLCSGAVLVLEIVGLRLIAPYVGVTLQTSTAVIGFALAAIAMGAYAGGMTADRSDPRRLIAPLMVGGGALIVAVLPLVRFTGSVLAGTDAGGVLLLAAIAVVVPAALLSAVPPMVVKLQLASLTETGSVVGRLSGIGTLGAIAATFATGFVLVALLPSSVILVATGVVTLLAGVAVGLFLRRSGSGAGRVPPGLLVLAVVGAGLAAVAPTPCEEETAYHCARVVADPERDTGRVLVLDTLRHSYVDVDDPTHLEFEYVRAIASTVEAVLPSGEPISALHLGGGGLTLPRWLAETRPGTDSLVLEVDPGVVVDRPRADGAPDVRRTAGAGRRRPRRSRRRDAGQPRPRRRRRLRRAVGAVAADHPGVVGAGRPRADRRGRLRGQPHRPPAAALRPRRARHDARGLPARRAAGPRAGAGGGGRRQRRRRRLPLAAAGRPAARRRCPTSTWPGRWRRATSSTAFVGDAAVLTDDHAPVDQLLTPYGS